MIAQLKPALVIFVLFTVITGVLYPAVVTGLAQVFFPARANGSMIEIDGKVYGSELIGQGFSEPKYFWSRPSATSGHAYNAFDPIHLTGSSGSNLGPLSQTLIDSVRQRVAALHTADPTQTDPIPVDLVTASASGLDPHISLASASYQIPRVARARGLSPTQVKSLVDRYTTSRQFSILGEPVVNVLLLNLALDGIK